MVFIEACLGPVRLMRSSRTRSSGQNWTPSTIQTIQTPSRPGSRRTKSAGRKLAGEDPPLPRPLRAQTLLHSTTLRAYVHLLPEPSEPLRELLARTRTPVRALLARTRTPMRADRAYNYTPLFRGGRTSSRPSLSHWQVLVRKSLFVSHWLVLARKSLFISLTGQNGRQAP